jgi:serine/threonine-protein kinase RsbW
MKKGLKDHGFLNFFWYNWNMKKKSNRILLEFVSDLKYTEFCVLVFSFLKKSLHFEEDSFFKIEISLREVINNAIIHGNKSDINKRVYVAFEWTKKCLTTKIKDENDEKVDFDAINKKLDENDLLAFNGRGIMIIKSYMDKVEFKPSDKGTEIVMEKCL